VNRLALFFLVLLMAHPAESQLSRNSRWVKNLRDKYDVTLNIAYTAVDTVNARLDLYVPRDAKELRPVLMWFHGGGWSRLSKDSVSGQIIPYLEMGWIVVNVDYRLTPVALAPAAVEDCRCALRWVYQHAAHIGADTTRIVLSGTSSGGHLALITGMAPAGVGLDKNCPGPELNVSAIINFYGVTDLVDLQTQSKNRRGFAISWLGDGPQADETARLVSPLTYVRRDLCPILTVHGDSDPTVPYDQAVRLHRALEDAGARHELMTIPGGVHGKFSKEQNVSILERITAFLKEHKIAN